MVDEREVFKLEFGFVIFRNMNKFVLCASLCIGLSLAACDDDGCVTDSRDGRTYKTVTIGN